MGRGKGARTIAKFVNIRVDHGAVPVHGGGRQGGRGGGGGGGGGGNVAPDWGGGAN